MMRLPRQIWLFLSLGWSNAAIAQTATSIQAPAGYAPVYAPCVQQSDRSCLPISAANPLPVASGADPAAGAGSATARAVQNADGSKLATDVQLIGAVTQLTTLVAKQSAILAALQGTLTVQQASLPAFATTPTVNLGAAPSLTVGSSALPVGAATDVQLVAAVTKLGSILAALGAPMQSSGGSVTTYLPQLAVIGRSGLFGTTASQLMPANSSRHFIQVQVQSTSSNCYLNGSTTATADQNGLLVYGGSTFESSSHVGTGAISIVCTAANTPVFAREG